MPSEAPPETVTFKVGDIVKLNSGGPTMTIRELGADECAAVATKCCCVWFDSEDEFHSGVFPLAGLVAD